MTTDLRERLGEVAARAPGDVPASDLWRRGRRRQVRRAAASAAALAVLAVVTGVGGGALWTQLAVDGEPGPVTTPPTELVLPDRIFTPSPWLPGTDEVGPGGPYVALVGAERKRWDGGWRPSSANGVAALAADGSYRFLDLPDYVGDHGWFDEGQELALSSDGRYIGYWITGDTTDEPLLMTKGGEPTGGVAVYDTATGNVSRLPISTPHGVAAGTFAWAGDVIRFNYGAYETGGVSPTSWGSQSLGQATWDARASKWNTEVDYKNYLDFVSATPSLGWFVADNGARHALVGPDGIEARFKLDRAAEAEPTVGPGGRRLAMIYDPNPVKYDGVARRLLVGELGSVDSRGRVIAEPVPDVRAHEVLGWRDQQHVIVLRYAIKDGGAFSVDIATGDETLLMALPDQRYGDGVQVATAAWSAPTMQAVEPDWPMGTPARAGLIAGSVLAIAAALTWWRRRRVRA